MATRSIFTWSSTLVQYIHTYAYYCPQHGGWYIARNNKAPCSSTDTCLSHRHWTQIMKVINFVSNQNTYNIRYHIVKKTLQAIPVFYNWQLSHRHMICNIRRNFCVNRFVSCGSIKVPTFHDYYRIWLFIYIFNEKIRYVTPLLPTEYIYRRWTSSHPNLWLVRGRSK